MVSTLAALLLAEGLSRLVLNPVDYLAVNTVHDPVLRGRLEPGAGGHDEWGFRNRAVPEQADIITIGDSQTYGVSAPARRSWPAQLAELTGRTVYNLGLGGYGPVQYRELLRTKALQLKPAAIVVGLYYGNDLWDAYATVYGLRHWAALRRPDLPLVGDSTGIPSARKVFLAPARDWLARHSVVYRLVTYSALGGYARGVEFTARDTVRGSVPFQHPVHGARTGLTPSIRLKVLDLQDPRVQEGVRLSLEHLEMMAEDCRVAEVRLLLALIPTKERVHAPWFTSDMPEYEALRRLVENESEADRRVREHLDARGIEYIDLTTPLREAAAVGPIYPANEDGHPNADGYAIIAKAVAGAIGDSVP